ncbi:hypothetical protein HPB49_021502 [Dermacentor silvarum]|uniref:Uncharacterized protein n=1 Tax=Dermacentor silvarum TaxID=543639 RepID=A0ACB8CBD7_DERSI|nr:hypothetical protein HPB49_021502 [Dermacentor silvarum]
MASPSSSRLPGFDVQSSVLSVTYDKLRPHFATCVIIFVVAVAVVVISAFVHISQRWPAQQEVAGERGSPFCCREELLESLRYINTSLNPCRDFFAYVCSSVIKLHIWPEANNEATFERIVFTGVMPPGAPRSKAGEFLVAYHRSCLETVSRESIASALAGALVRKQREVLKNMDVRKAFIYATAATVKYKLRTAFYVLKLFNEQNASVGTALICSSDDSYSRDALTASVDAVNSVLRLAVTAQRTLELKANICSVYRANREGIVAYTAANLSDFEGDVWNLEDVEAGLAANGLSLSTALLFTVNQSRTIRAILDVFSSERNDGSTGATYLLWHSVLRGIVMFKTSSDGPPQRVFEVCKREITDLRQLGRLFQTNIFTSRERDAQFRVIFDAVKDAVRADLQSSRLVEADDVARLERFFRDIALITPSEVVDTGSAVPVMSPNFASDLLESREFEFKAGKAFFAHFDEKYLFRFAHLDIAGNHSVYISINLYYYIRTGGANVELSNMAVVGRILAEALWFMVFRTVTWTSQTTTNILHLKECYDSYYWNSTAYDAYGIPPFFTALGLSSVLNAFYRPQWLTLKPAWGWGRMSHAQLFYILATYARCPKSSTPRDVSSINGPLTYIRDFADAFQCRSDAPMAKRHRCSLPALGR